MMLPTAFVRPSLKTILVPTWRNTLNEAEPASPVGALCPCMHSEDGGCLTCATTVNSWTREEQEVKGL